MYGELLQSNTIGEDKCNEIASDLFALIASVNLPEMEEEKFQSAGSFGATDRQKSVDQSGTTNNNGGSMQSRRPTMDNHLSTHGKRLTAAEQIKLIGFKTIKEK